MGLHTNRTLRGGGAAALGLATVLATGALTASPALAATSATVSMNTHTLGKSLSYNGGTGNNSNLKIFREAGEITITDTVTISAGTGCRIVSAGKARCGTSINTMLVQLGDGADAADVDVETSGQIFGDAGNDTLSAGRTGSGGVAYNGGTDFDTVSYSRSAAAVTVTLDGAANDGRLIGSANGRDHVKDDVERLSGSELNDRLTGDERRNDILGLGGVDTINPGTNVDNVNGGNGNDVFSIRDNFVDTVNGGAGTDSATVDRSFDSLTLVETIS